MNNNIKKKNLIKNTIILMLGKICTQFITFLLLPLYTLYLSTGEYGAVDLITTYITLFVPVITLQVEMYLFRFLIENRENDEKKKNIVSNCYFVALIISGFCILIFTGLNVFINIEYFIYIVLMLIVTIWSNLVLQTARGLGDNLGYSISCIITGSLNLILNLILLLVFKLGIYSIFISTIFSNFIGGLFLFCKNKMYIYFSLKKVNKNYAVEIIKYTFPLITNGIVWWIINASDRTVISLFLGIGANGLYAISNKFSNILNSLYSIFNMSWMESVSLYINDKDDFLSDTFNKIFVLLCSMCLILLCSMFIIFPFFIKGNYSDAYNYIYILIISSIFNMMSSNLSAIYIALKKTKQIAYTTIIAAVANFVINIVLINKIGLYAAALSTLIAFFILFILRYFDVQKYTVLKLNKKNMIIFLIMFSLSAIIYFCNSFIFQMAYLIFSCILVLFLNKNIILNLYNKVINRLKLKKEV